MTEHDQPSDHPSARPQWSPDGRAWWDGTTWIPRHIVEAQHGARWAAAQPPQHPTASQPNSQPYPQTYTQPYAQPVPGQVAPGPRKGGLPMWLAVLLAIVGGTAVLTVAVFASIPKDPAEKGPQAEKDFVEIVAKGQDAAGTDNEVTIVNARKERAEAMCNLLPESLEVTDWVGRVAEVQTTLGGDSGILDVEIADDINVTTWNNVISDLGDGTLIDPDGEVYAALSDLDEGDEITFSGAFVGAGDGCISEQSLFDENGMRTPAFLFKFADVTKN